MGSFSMKVILLSSSFFLSSAAPPHFAFCSFGARHTWSGVILRTLRSPRFFSPFFKCFQQISTGFVSPFSPSYTIQSAILHWWAFSITDTLASPKNSDLGSKKFRWFYRGSWGTCHTLQRRVGNGLQGFLQKRKEEMVTKDWQFFIRNYKLNCQPFVVTLRYLKALVKIFLRLPKRLTTLWCSYVDLQEQTKWRSTHKHLRCFFRGQRLQVYQLDSAVQTQSLQISFGLQRSTHVLILIFFACFFCDVHLCVFPF